MNIYIYKYLNYRLIVIRFLFFTFLSISSIFLNHGDDKEQEGDDEEVMKEGVDVTTTTTFLIDSKFESYQ